MFISNGACNAETDNEYVDYNSFDYLVFWYDAEPNSFVTYLCLKESCLGLSQATVNKGEN